MSIPFNILTLRKHIPANVKLVCISKFQPDEAVMEAYSTGERIFGESKVQELCGKYGRLPKDIRWHFIGHLQTNKIRNILPFVEMIHGVDSFKLLSEINRQAERQRITTNCLLQVHIAEEETKFGFSPDELIAMLDDGEWKTFSNVQLCGLMGMATFTDNKELIRKEFRLLKALFNYVKVNYLSEKEVFKEISMGMSDDYQIAIEEGCTMVRVGSKIFGTRTVL